MLPPKRNRENVTIRERQDQGAVGDKGFRAVHGGEDLGNQDRLACLASRALHFIHNYLQIRVQIYIATANHLREAIRGEDIQNYHRKGDSFPIENT
jgi:hypothetical protein